MKNFNINMTVVLQEEKDVSEIVEYFETYLEDIHNAELICSKIKDLEK
ncbi:Uncharacterised protein [[Clostridium] sordellii]|nr:hypothetical protein [Paeniclostridium sordellii]CEQ01677.1 Uncharacterised protein [[Clostridium] sordellii] [Paeniclostridium sordellii]